MTLATAKQVARLIFDPSLVRGRLDIVWHGGEPLSLPPSYYTDVIEILETARPKNLSVQYGVQTNGTLINDTWINLFEKHRMTVGISLDGPPDLHDENRKLRSGVGSHARVVSGLVKLQARGYPFHFIGVLTATSLAHASKLSRYYLQLNPTAIGLNIEEIEAQNRNSSLSVSSIFATFKDFIRDFLAEAVRQNHPSTALRDFQRTISFLISGTPDDNDQVIPLRIVSIASNGDISTFSPELLALDTADRNKFVFGNVHQCGSLLDILDDPRFKESYFSISRGVEQCARSCEYFQYCGGGAPVNKFSEKGSLDATETLYCLLTKKAWVDVCLELVEAAGASFHATR